MVPQDAYMENLTTPLPPPPICVRRAGNISWRYDNERKNLNFHNFMKSSSGHLKITFSWLQWPKKTPWCRKLLLNIQKKKTLKLFQKTFLSYVHCGHVEGSFDNIAERFSPSYRKLSPKLPKLIYLIFIQKKTIFLNFVHLTRTM